MQEYSIQDFIAEAEKQEKFLQTQIGRFDALLADYDQKTRDLRAKKQQAITVITRKLLPEFTPDALRNLARLIGNSAVAGLHAEYLREQETLANRLKAIEANENYQKREFLLAPETGVLTSQAAELEGMYNEAAAFCGKLESMKRFNELATRRFGTDEYPHRGVFRFFKSEYLTDWKYADIITAAMKEPNFAAILEQYDEAKNRRMVFGQSLADVRAHINAIAAAAAEHEEKQKLLENIADRYAVRVGSFVAEWLRNAGAAAINALAAGGEELPEEARRADGLEHQIDYIRGLAEKVTADRNVLVTKSDAITQEAMRYKADPYRFRNKRWERGSFAKKFDRDSTRYDKLHRKYEQTGETIYVFNDYGRGSMMQDFLWWDIMTDGRLDGNFIPEVNEYRGSHPDYSYSSAEHSSSVYDNS